jgi:VanZ family protein
MVPCKTLSSGLLVLCEVCKISSSLIFLWGFSILFCLLYASSDEIHQIFVPGRGCLFTDVMIDFSGSIIGSLTMLGLAMVMKQKSKKAEKIMERE